jgi:hypothetical protein
MGNLKVQKVVGPNETWHSSHHDINLTNPVNEAQLTLATTQTLCTSSDTVQGPRQATSCFAAMPLMCGGFPSYKRTSVVHTFGSHNHNRPLVGLWLWSTQPALSQHTNNHKIDAQHGTTACNPLVQPFPWYTNQVLLG